MTCLQVSESVCVEHLEPATKSSNETVSSKSRLHALSALRNIATSAVTESLLESTKDKSILEKQLKALDLLKDQANKSAVQAILKCINPRNKLPMSKVRLLTHLVFKNAGKKQIS